MQLYPAIDLKNGQCVRLTQGDFDKVKIYEADPLLQARKFAENGASWLHIVDLDGARSGQTQQIDLIAKIASQTPLKIQTGGGIRSEKTIQELLDLGIERVVIGSLAVKDKALVREWLKKFGPQHVVIALDIKFLDDQPVVLTQGWQNESEQLLWDILDAYEQSGLRHLLCTDVGRDGMLLGANISLYKSIHEKAPKIEVLASGGISGVDDLLTLNKIPVAGAIIGKAIYEGRIDLKEAIDQVNHAG